MLTTIDVIFYVFYSGAFPVWAPPKNTVCDLGSHFESAPVKLLFSQMLVGGRALSLGARLGSVPVCGVCRNRRHRLPCLWLFPNLGSHRHLPTKVPNDRDRKSVV